MELSELILQLCDLLKELNELLTNIEYIALKRTKK